MHMCLDVRGTHAQQKPTVSNVQSNQGGGLYEYTEYDAIADDRNEKGQGSPTDDFNAADDAITTIEKTEHTYDHAKTSRTPAFDSNYSHITGHKGKLASPLHSNYDQACIKHSGKALIQSNTILENNKYEVLKKPTERLGLGEQPNMQVEPDSEYDHAQAGGSEPIVLDYYSHLDKEPDTSNPKSTRKK